MCIVRAAPVMASTTAPVAYMPLERSSRALAVFMATVTLALLVTLPAWAVASPARLASSDAAASDCV